MPHARTETLVTAFLDRTLPPAEWTHEAHLRVGLWHVLRHGPDEGLRRLRAAIRAYNEVRGVANTASTGYHETITRFYVWLIHGFVKRTPARGDVDALAAALIAAHGARDLPFHFWSDERLFSPAAQSGWVPPDLQPLPPADATVPPGMPRGSWRPGEA